MNEMKRLMCLFKHNKAWDPAREGPMPTADGRAVFPRKIVKCNIFCTNILPPRNYQLTELSCKLNGYKYIDYMYQNNTYNKNYSKNSSTV
jgi:hypothetical protein